MNGLSAWIEILDTHFEVCGSVDVGLALEPSELVRLRHDLQTAANALTKAVHLAEKTSDELKTQIALTERAIASSDAALTLARKFSELVKFEEAV